MSNTQITIDEFLTKDAPEKESKAALEVKERLNKQLLEFAARDVVKAGLPISFTYFKYGK